MRVQDACVRNSRIRLIPGARQADYRNAAGEVGRALARMRGNAMTESLEDNVLRKIKWRLLPIAMLLFFMSLLDRTNISFAALDMNKDLGLTFPQYGVAASIFYIGYFLFEIPSNFALQKVGARIWLARIMITWGAVVIGHAFVQDGPSLYAVRFLLGVTEAGLLPGLLLYLSLWLPARQRGLAFGTLLSTTAIAYAAGGPFTTLLMTFTVSGLKGWQAMYMVEGVLTVGIGVMVLFLLPGSIKDAEWLAADEKAWLQRQLDEEENSKKAAGATTVREGFLDGRVVATTVTCFFLLCTNFGTVLFLPQILKQAYPAMTTVQISLLISVAFAIGGVAGIIWGRHSDQTGDRKWHMAAGAVLAAGGYAYAAFADTPELRFAGICVAVLGIWSMFGAFWAYAGDILGGAAAAGGLALINSVGSLGGFVAPNVLTYARGADRAFDDSLIVLSGFALITALLAAALPKVERPHTAAFAGGA
jgi:MFS transporter, ACS family, tartrate transporter